MQAITIDTTQVDGVRVGSYGWVEVEGTLQISVLLLNGRRIELCGEAVEAFLKPLSAQARAWLIRSRP